MLTIGQPLPNGAILLAAKPVGDNGPGTGYIVLADWRGEYVTWYADQSGTTYLGHYYDDYETGLSAFGRRS